jgi:hypothetical protein
MHEMVHSLQAFGTETVQYSIALCTLQVVGAVFFEAFVGWYTFTDVGLIFIFLIIILTGMDFDYT